MFVQSGLIIAHAERYPELLYDPARTARWIAAGCMIQATARALADRTDIAFCFVGGGSELPTVRRWAADPDAFIRSKIEEFAGGNRGNPGIPDAIKKMMGRKPISNKESRTSVVKST